MLQALWVWANKMVQTNRYNRQELFWGQIGQAKLSNSIIAIVGEDSFAFPAALNSALVGLNTRLLITGKSLPGDYALDFPLEKDGELGLAYETILSQINPLVRVSQLPVTLESRIDEHFLAGADAIVDVTNNPKSKKIGLEFALANNIHFISSYCFPGFSVMRMQNADQYSQGGPKDLFLAWPIGALAIQEAVSFILAAKEQRESLLDEYSRKKFFLSPGYSYPFDSSGSESPRHIRESLEDKTALVVGVGGQGGFAAQVLIMLKYGRVFYMDSQTVEDHNLSRQHLYWDSVGRKKAEVCAEKHNRIAGREVAFPLVHKFDENTAPPEGIDVIYGMTDNMFSRMAMSNYAARNNKIFVSAGSDHSGADISFYVPGKTMCYTHLNRVHLGSAKEAERQARVHCTENPNPQVVMSNCFAGSMAALLSAYLFKDSEAFNGVLTYRPDLDPAFGRLSRQEICNCHTGDLIDLVID